MDRLSIASLEVEQFGGWSRRRLVLPSDQFVVVHGQNETGKSTVAELIAWLLAGPRGSAVDAQRFGAAGDTIGGVLNGHLGADRFEATGRFKVLKAGTPNIGGLSVSMGDTLTAAQWRQRLGGVDDQVLAAVYRLSGHDLHDGTGVEQHLSRVALAALGSRIDPRSLVQQLTEEARKLTTAKAAESDSVLRCRGRVQIVEQQIAAASRNADEYAAVVVEIEQCERRRRAVHERQQGVARRRGAIATVLGTVELRAKAADDEATLAALEPVPAEWVALAADPDGVERAVASARRSEQACLEAEARLAAARHESGMHEESVAGIVITDAVLAEVSRLSTLLGQADDAAAKAVDDEVRWRAALANSTHRADAALGSAGGADRAGVLAALMDAQPRADLAQAVGTWRSAIATGDQRRRMHEDSEAAERRARQELDTAEAAWERWIQGRTPQEWQLAHRTAVRSALRPGRGWPWWTPAAAVGVLAPVAVVLNAPVVAALAAVVAVIVLLLSRPRSTHPDVAADADPDVAAAATALIAAELRHADTATAVVGAAGAVKSAADDLARVHHELSDLARSLRLTIADTPEATVALHLAWLGAASAVSAERDTRLQVDSAVGAVERARTQVGRAEADVRDAMRACGVTVEVPPRGSAAIIGRFRAASVSYHEVVEARLAARHARAVMDELLAPVAANTRDWSPERVAEEVRRWNTRQVEMAALAAAVADTKGLLDARLGDDPDVRALFDRGLSQFELAHDTREAEGEQEAVQAQADEVGERIGELRRQQEELAHVERLGALHVAKGTLEEHQQDLALRAVVSTVAAAMLRTVADGYERAHQPALIERTTAMARLAAPEWEGVLVRRDGGGGIELLVQHGSGAAVPTTKLSTGARALLYLALRVAMAEHDAESRGVRLPLLCDDPLVHLDDERATEVVRVLKAASEAGHQVVLFTCHLRTVHAAQNAGAEVTTL